MTWWKVTVTSQQSITIGTGTTRAFHTPSLGYIRIFPEAPCAQTFGYAAI